MNAIDVVVGYLERRPRRALDNDDVARTQMLVLDGIGCLLGGIREESVRRALDLPVPDAGPEADRVGDSTPPRRPSGWPPSFVYGVALRYLDYLDVYSSRDTCHPSEHMPVALALAASAGASGRDFLEALAVGYEVQCRLADAVNLRDGGMHHVTAAAISVPLMAARLGIVDPDQVREAIALAACGGVALRSISRGRLSMAKAFAFPLAARRAVDCVRLAAAGVTGPSDVLDDLLHQAGGGDADLAAAFAEAATSDHLAQIQLKSYPVQYALQAVVEAGLALHKAFRGRHSEVARIVVHTSEEVLSNTTDPAKRHAATREAADHSLFSCLAMAIVLGEVSVDSFHRDAWLRHDVDGLVDMITCQVWQGSGAAGQTVHPLATRVQLEFVDGTVVAAAIEAPLGSASRPMSDAQVVEKFRQVSAQAVSADAAERVVSEVDSLASRESVTDLLDILEPWTVPGADEGGLP